MKRLLVSVAVFAFAACSYAQDSPSLGEVARQNQEQKKASHTYSNDDLGRSSSDSGVSQQPALAAEPSAAQTSSSEDGSAKPADATSDSTDDPAKQAKPDRSNFVGDVPGETADPKDRLETLKKHAGQWDTIVANLEKKIAAEKDSEKRQSLETMLDHARQNQAKDAAEQQSLEKSEAEKAEKNGEGPAAADQPAAQGDAPATSTPQ